MNRYYKIYPVSMDSANVEITINGDNYNLNNLDSETVESLMEVLDLLYFEDRTE